MSDKDKLKQWFSDMVDALPDDIALLYSVDDIQSFDKSVHTSGVGVYGISESVLGVELRVSFVFPAEK